MQLATPRLLLREFAPEDWRAVLTYQSDPRYCTYYPWTERSDAEVRTFVDRFVAWQREQPRARYQFAVTLHGALIGNGGLRRLSAQTPEADMGYELDPRYWGHGYATEVARALLAFGFGQLRLHRVWAECIAENIASARVLEKAGLRLEGWQREKVAMKGRWWDVLLYAILEQEWSGA